MNEPEPLYYGDMRLDALSERIKEVIFDAAEKQDIPLATVLGLLDIIKYQLLSETNE